jgi:hypothetical protein
MEKQNYSILVYQVYEVVKPTKMKTNNKYTFVISFFIHALTLP